MKLKILITDDNEGDILLFEESLEIVQDYLLTKDLNIEFSLDKALNGETALQLLEQNSYDLLFTDIKMNKISGLDVLKSFRERNMKGRFIIFTTSDYEKDIVESYHLNADGYLLKSLDISEFEENLKNIIFIFMQDSFAFINTIHDRFKNIIKK